VLREVGGDAALFCPVADVSAWTQTTCALLERHDDRERVAVRTARAARFSWDTYSDKTVEVYRAVAEVSAGRKTALSVQGLEPTTESH
jgi:glycosyltransferase involved in cell wall biosynthesis